jgi:hypothetical protein
MAWTLIDIPEIAPGDLVHARLADGDRALELLAYVRFAEGRAWICGLHVQGAGPGSLGVARLRGLAEWAMEALDVDEIRIEGAARTSGAGPGRSPAPLVFRRRRRAGAAAGGGVRS